VAYGNNLSNMVDTSVPQTPEATASSPNIVWQYLKLRDGSASGAAITVNDIFEGALRHDAAALLIMERSNHGSTIEPSIPRTVVEESPGRTDCGAYFNASSS
jgi:hypothetical protein